MEELSPYEELFTTFVPAQGLVAAATSWFRVSSSCHSCYRTNSNAKVMNSIANGTNSIAKVTNSIDKTCKQANSWVSKWDYYSKV